MIVNDMKAAEVRTILETAKIMGVEVTEDILKYVVDTVYNEQPKVISEETTHKKVQQEKQGMGYPLFPSCGCK